MQSSTWRWKRRRTVYRNTFGSSVKWKTRSVAATTQGHLSDTDERKKYFDTEMIQVEISEERVFRWTHRSYSLDYIRWWPPRYVMYRSGFRFDRKDMFSIWRVWSCLIRNVPWRRNLAATIETWMDKLRSSLRWWDSTKFVQSHSYRKLCWYSLLESRFYLIWNRLESNMNSQDMFFKIRTSTLKKRKALCHEHDRSISCLWGTFTESDRSTLVWYFVDHIADQIRIQFVFDTHDYMYVLYIYIFYTSLSSDHKENIYRIYMSKHVVVRKTFLR